MARVRLIRPGEGSAEQDAFLAATPPLNLFAALAHSPVLARRFAGLGAGIMTECTLAPELREVAALRVACRRKAPYVLAQHRRVARGLGMTEAAIAATQIATTQADEGGAALSPLQRRVLSLVDALTAAADGIDESDIGALKAELGEAGLVELLATIGFFSMVAAFTTGLQLELE